MLRKLAIALAAAAAITAGSTHTAAAMHGGGMGHGGGGMGHGGFGHMGMGGFGHGGMGGFGHAGMGGFGHAGFGHPGFVHTANFGHFDGGRSFGFRERHDHDDRFAHRRFFHGRFAFFGAPFAYDDDSCYTRVWTRWGWRWRSDCY